MPYALFHSRCPDVADRETRTIQVMENSGLELPADHFSFLEMYCDEEGCDCRRVMFYVISENRGDAVQAVIAWGWELREFYVKWMRDDDPATINSLKGPALNFGSPETELAPALLDLTRNVLLRDPNYVARIKRHYALFRKSCKAKTSETTAPARSSKTSPPRTATGPNQRCPCGSGKKFKNCCGRH